MFWGKNMRLASWPLSVQHTNAALFIHDPGPERQQRATGGPWFNMPPPL